MLTGISVSGKQTDIGTGCSVEVVGAAKMLCGDLLAL